MDGLSFYKILRLIAERYKGASLNRLTVLGNRLYLSFYKGGHLVLCFRASQPPLFAMAELAAGECPSVLDVLNGASFIGTGSRLYDRVGWLDFEKRRPSGRLVNYRLVLEPMGGYANAFLLNEESKITFRLTSGSIDPDRDISPGKAYVLPKANKKATLADYGTERDFAALVGFYPPTTEAAGKYAEKYGFEKASELIAGLLDTDDCFYKVGKYILPFPPLKVEAEKIPFETYTLPEKDSKKPEEADAVLQKRIVKLYSKQLTHYEKLSKKLEKEIEAAKNWESFRKKADLIKSNLHLFKGRGVYELTDYTVSPPAIIHYVHEGEDVVEEMRKLYKRAAKLSRSLLPLGDRLREVEQLADASREQIYYAKTADTKELKELSELLKEKPGKKQSGKKQEMVFITAKYGEAQIYLGRNSAQNHRLVFQFAISGDLWLHARQIPSAHCLIRKTGTITEDEILFAARLVARYSKNKKEARVPVDYTLRRYVKKPKNTPVGYVTYSQFKTILAEPFTEEEATSFMDV